MANFKTKKKSNVISIYDNDGNFRICVGSERIYSMNKTVLTFTTLNKLNTARKKHYAAISMQLWYAASVISHEKMKKLQFFRIF